ncbi:PepSY-associated TM helix domain-containing protein [Sphingomonas sp. QA11]|uniref:PepSY-associated TM helix domain-containing protein n=1 Tax=Sphingomonas sp. QA11 TaxID=2950605 RepID=UPI00234BB974|nr:PepSY-associated TM helix domain-containing protein [Sphingomonas sp. QA11]WCM25608.1 PepSY-associated TM helix domain-containing protein [Sphingomonas sp. QA11]
MTIQAARQKPRRKTFWLKQLHTWHWISSALSLVGLLLFAVTGFTLNHAADIEAKPTVVAKAAALPAPLLRAVAPVEGPDVKKPLPPEVATWVEAHFPASARGDAEWSADEIYLALPRPGGDGWVSINRASGAVTSEFTDRGWISYLNDLHKGRNSGAAWKWFIDIFAFACLVFALTGLVLLQLHAAKRPITWPLVALGLAIPAGLAVFFIH